MTVVLAHQQVPGFFVLAVLGFGEVGGEDYYGLVVGGSDGEDVPGVGGVVDGNSKSPPLPLWSTDYLCASSCGKDGAPSVVSRAGCSAARLKSCPDTDLISLTSARLPDIGRIWIWGGAGRGLLLAGCGWRGWGGCTRCRRGLPGRRRSPVGRGVEDVAGADGAGPFGRCRSLRAGSGT